MWVTYGCIEEKRCKGQRVGLLMPKNKLYSEFIRKNRFYFGEFRTYYAGIFKTIPMSYFEGSDGYYYYGYDLAKMLYLLDVAGEHTYYMSSKLGVRQKKNEEILFFGKKLGKENIRICCQKIR